MHLLRNVTPRLALALATLAMVLSTSTAFAQNEPCGAFDFSDGVFDCKIEAELSCSAQCTDLSFTAGCSGGCTATPDPDCVNPCGEGCIIECNPELLDCFQGCHDECDAMVQAECEAKHPQEDCVEQAQAQCNMHCKESCKVPPSNCQEHCEQCCFGGCNTLKNFDCDFDCFAELKGSCDVSCAKPEGAIFCNGQYVNATSINECVNWLAAQGIAVEAKAEVTCQVGNCDVGLDGCTASSGRGSDGEAEGTLAMMLFGLVFAVRRRRKNKE